MIEGFRREKIDQLRELLGEPNRNVVSVHSLAGTYDWFDSVSLEQRITSSGDVAYIFLGPKTALRGTVTYDKEYGITTYTFEIGGEGLKDYTVYWQGWDCMEVRTVKAKDAEHAAQKVADKEQSGGTFHVHEGNGETVSMKERKVFEREGIGSARTGRG